MLVNKDRQDALTQKVDRVLTHRGWSIPIFLAIMALVFFLTFTIGDWLKGYFELGIESLSGAVNSGLIAAGVNDVLRSLLVDGIIAGVGGILTFLPNIFILFLALAFLEDSGYMAACCLCHGGDYEQAGVIRQGLYSDDTGVWMYRPGNYGITNSWKTGETVLRSCWLLPL